MILSKILSYSSCKLYAMSETKQEYKKLYRTITCENKLSDISPELINKALMENVQSKVTDINDVYLIHDPSDIRKPHTKKSENIGKVRDLNGNIINGYSSYNIVSIIPNDNTINLLSHCSYSNKDENFLKLEDVKKLEANKDFDGKEKAFNLYNSSSYFNKKSLSIKEITRVSKELKQSNPKLKITHIFDREFDDRAYFDLIDSTLFDDFIIRVKKSKVLNDIKLITSEFENSYEVTATKLRIKNKCYQDAKILIEYSAFNGYTVVRVSIKNRKGNNIFKDPMLLITNKKIDSRELAYKVYLTYLKRSKIEYVFRFLKESLGWEEIQIRDFTGIQNLLSLCFYVSAYLYGIEEEIARDDFVIKLAKIGGGKEKVTRFFILKGLKMLISKVRIERIFKELNISKEEQDELEAIARANLMIE